MSVTAQTFDPPNLRRGVVAGGKPVTSRFFLSANGQYRLTLEDGAIVNRNKTQLIATVSKIEGNVAVIRWTGNFEGLPTSLISDRDVIVSDDGKFFLFAENLGRDWSIYVEGKRPESLVTSRDLFPPRGPLNSQERLIEIDQLNGEPIVRIWNAIWNRWSAFYVNSNNRIVVTDDLDSRWNDATGQKILDALSRARLEIMRQKVGAVSQKLGEIAGTALASLKAPDIREVHYEFLALRRRPEDRVWFERLLNESDPKARQSTPFDSYVTFRVRNGGIQTMPANLEYYFYEETSYARTRGDWLLANFDKKDLRAILESDRPLFYLGSISGTVKLPAPILKRAGKIRIYLAPENRAKKDFSTNDVEAIEATLDNQLPTYDFSEEVSFKFGTVSAGKYCLKVVWDKRPGFNDTTKPGPGDYESAWTPPINVTPGISIKDVAIECNLRAAEGAPYYAADEMTVRKWKVTGELSLFNYKPESEGRREIFGRPVNQWIIKTNVESHSMSHGIVRVALVTRPPALDTNSLPRPPELVFLARRGSILQSAYIRLRILDEHGCTYVPTITRSFGQFTTATFPSYPRNAKTFRLVAFGRAEAPAFDYTLTNLFHNAPPIRAPAQQLPVEISIGNVTMTAKRISGDPQKAQMEASFTENGEWTNGWWASEVLFGDADGNIIDPEDACREQQVTRILGRISRNTGDARETRPFAFTIPRWKPYVEKD